VQISVDKLWKTWDTYAQTTLANFLNHRMVRTNQYDSVLMDARTGARCAEYETSGFRLAGIRLPAKVPAAKA
jgi:hypothetical protein